MQSFTTVPQVLKASANSAHILLACLSGYITRRQRHCKTENDPDVWPHCSTATHRTSIIAALCIMCGKRWLLSRTNGTGLAAIHASSGFTRSALRDLSAPDNYLLAPTTYWNSLTSGIHDSSSTHFPSHS